MRIQIDKSELYPCYGIDEEIDDPQSAREIPDDKVAWIKRVNGEWAETQDYLENLFHDKKSI